MSPGAAWADTHIKDAAHMGLLTPATLVPSPATFLPLFHFPLAFPLLLLTTGPSCGHAYCAGFQHLGTDWL